MSEYFKGALNAVALTIGLAWGVTMAEVASNNAATECQCQCSHTHTDAKPRKPAKPTGDADSSDSDATTGQRIGAEPQ